MESWQQLFLASFGLFSLAVFIKGYLQAVVHKDAFGDTKNLVWMGIFVWGDAVIIALFWFFASVISYFLYDWILFWLIFWVFWVVRSLGEVVYWLNEQFVDKHRNPPQNLRGYKLFKNDSIYFIYQIIWQCVTVVSMVFSIYISFLWFGSK